MRLSQDEINILKSTILEYVNDAKIILFGSRTDDTKKGGDIHIFVKEGIVL